MQSTFLNAHRAIRRGVTPEAELAWLFKIAHNVCLTRRRSTSRRGRVEATSDLHAMQDYLPAPSRESADELIRLTDALAHMPDNQRRAILLREWQGLSYHEIARELKLSQSAVETLIFRARRSLAANLEETPEKTTSVLARARAAFDVSAVLAALKGLFEAGAAVKAAAAAVAVTGAAVVATAPLEPAKQAPKPAPAPVVATTEPESAVLTERPPVLLRDVAARRARSERASAPPAPKRVAPVAETPVTSEPVATLEPPAPAPQPEPEKPKADKPVEPPSARPADPPKKDKPKAEKPVLLPQPEPGNPRAPKDEKKDHEPGPPAGVTPGPPADRGNNAGGNGHGKGQNK